MIWCLGMQASASTWVYNVVLKIIHASAPERRLKTAWVPRHGNVDLNTMPGEILVVKSHGVNAETAKRLSGIADTIIISIRDPRDILSSQLTHHGSDFRKALSYVQRSVETCEALSGDNRSLILRYEDLFFDDATSINAIAAAIHCELNGKQVERIFTETRRSAIEKQIAEIENAPTAKSTPDGKDVFDTVTQWHKHHANRTGKVGKWSSTLSARQVSRIEECLGIWMEGQNYKPVTRPSVISHLIKMTGFARS